MSADPRQRLVVAHSVDPAAAEHEVQGNLALARWLAEVQKLEFGGRYEPELHQRGPSTWSRPAPWSAGDRRAPGREQ